MPQNAIFGMFPQFASELSNAQMQQALANQLMQQGISGGNLQPAGGGYQHVPSYGAGNVVGDMARVLGGALLNRQANQTMADIYQQQAGIMTGQGMTPSNVDRTMQAEALAKQLGGTQAEPQMQQARMQVPQMPQQPQMQQQQMPQQQMQMQQQPRQKAPFAIGGQLNPSGIEPGMAYMMYTQNQGEYLKEFVAPFYKPTDMSRMLEEAGAVRGSQEAQQITMRKALKEAAPELKTASPGQMLIDPTTNRPVFSAPNVGEGMEPIYNAQGQFLGTREIPNYGSTLRGIKTQEAIGKGVLETKQVFNPQTGAMEFVPVAEVAGLSNAPNVPVMPAGGQQQLPSLQSLTQGQRNALNQFTAATAPAGLPGQPAQSQTGRFMAEAPLGMKEEVKALKEGQVGTMQESYKGLQQARATGMDATTMLNDMMQYATNKSSVLANKLYNYANVFSKDAQLFDKARANLITQISTSTGMTTDSARKIVEDSIPSYGLKEDAIKEGLRQINGQVQKRMIKADYMSDAYGQENAKEYNKRENQYDQTMTGNAALIMQMPPGSQRNAALQEAKKNPKDANALRWAINTGLLR